ncbi:hypothetical protein [Novosphingobium sp. HII-3]|uniref:hypothetical protein n=1 Tax=Novosphingobium sp. HII-3 TaxID=2075565 RepID=UPI0011AEC663|nr:hypothetical protein [Novosphingobium sp. HII-3]
MDKIEGLLAGVYPAVVVEQWTGADGWPCFKALLIADRHSDPVWDGVEHGTAEAAFDAAEILAERTGDCPVIDMIKAGG